MSAMSDVERSVRAVWMRGLSRRRMDGMASELGETLAEAHMRGRRMYLREGASVADMSAYHDRARSMAFEAMRTVESSYQQVSLRHGDDITAVLYLLFFDEDDSNLRYIPRGVPAAVSRRATRFDIPMASARRALEVISEDEDAQALVRTIPRRSVLRAMDAARRALNLGVAEAGMTAGIVTQERGLRFPLWEIREQMDSRTRGNPTGMYPLGGHHWQVSGYINTMAEIVRQDCVPPCGMNCRAGLHPVSQRRAETLGLVDGAGSVDHGAVRAYNGDRQGYIDRGQYPDPGFR
jgi:hypothetical protein